MKKTIAFCLALLMLCSFAPCASKLEGTPSESTVMGEEKDTSSKSTALEEWLDKSQATLREKGENMKSDFYTVMTVREIYADCFIGEDGEKRYKVNVALDKDICVGDAVTVRHDRMYWDEQNQKGEIDPISVEIPQVDAKPVIYLYPEVPSKVSVLLDYQGRLTCTYPTYRDGWQVTAAPDGTLTDDDGMTYNYLYWEGISTTQWDMSRGFCVKGEDTAAFLEDALAQFGLNRREANEFIVFWLPLMQENPYNIISFQFENYTESARLTVTPKPDTVIRVFMAYRSSDSYVALEPQELIAPERTGFTVVEWGGSEIKTQETNRAS